MRSLVYLEFHLKRRKSTVASHRKTARTILMSFHIVRSKLLIAVFVVTLRMIDKNTSPKSMMILKCDIPDFSLQRQTRLIDPYR